MSLSTPSMCPPRAFVLATPDGSRASGGIGFSPDASKGYVGDHGEDSKAVTRDDLIAALAAMMNLRATSPGTITVFDPATGRKLG